MLDRESLAWAAGVFDGEGHIGINKGRVYFDVTQAGEFGVPQMLLRLQNATGVGTVRGPYGPYKNKNRKPIYRYEIASFEHVQAFVAMVWAWLGDVKRAQAAAALDVASEPGPRGFLRRAQGMCKRGHLFDGYSGNQHTCSVCKRMNRSKR